MKTQNIVIILVLLCFVLWVKEGIQGIYDRLMNSGATTTGKLTYFKFHEDFSRTNTWNSSLKLFKSVFSKHEIPHNNRFNTSNIIFFHLIVNYIQLKRIVQQNRHVKFIYSLLCIDRLASKSELAMVLRSNLTQDEYTRFMPNTYALPTDQKRLENDFDPSKTYILKKNLQRQKGCLITNNKSDIIESNIRKNQFVVCQELLKDPYCINGHKINVRRYLLIIIKELPELFVYNEGFMYYAPKKYSKDSLSQDVHITTGYVDRKIYEMNPLTYSEFSQTLNETDAKQLDMNMLDLFTKLKDSYSDILVKEDGQNKHQTNFMICGCDIAVDKHLGCKLMEINKGPDLSGKDAIDTQIKTNLIEDSLKRTGILPWDNPIDNFVMIK